MSTFRCRRDSDIEDFLRNKAIPFEKAHKGRTYLVVGKESAESKELRIQAYFSLALSNMRIQKGVSRTQRKRLNGIFADDLVPCFLIGQLARNDQHPEEIGGDEIVAHAMSICKMGHDLVGGRFVRVDCRDIPGLVDFYERNGFRRLQTDDKTGLLQLVRFI